jgi:subtilisin family serine protease
VVDVVCRAEEVRASAQVTSTDARVLPTPDPYAGGVVLFKLRRTAENAESPVGRQKLGLRTLDNLLGALGAYAFPAFPFDRTGTLDRIGLDRWIVVDLPTDVNFYQAVALLRADPFVYPESYLPEDAGFMRVHAAGAWPVALQAPRPDRGSAEGSRPVSAGKYRLPARPPCAPPCGLGRARRRGVSWDLEMIGAPLAWKKGVGTGVGIAVIDTGVDTNHLSISANLRTKPEETPGFDADGNGVPGDWIGINFAHLAIAHGDGGPQLALGLLSNVSDWDGLSEARAASSFRGHGTAIAALAAGTGDAGERLGVAPRAWILPVDVQENLRVTESRLLEEDPRMRTVPGQPASFPPLRSPVWARAAGVAYAVSEGVRVLTCAWPPTEPHWILHDALLYAEDNCVLAVCAEKGSTPTKASPLPRVSAGEAGDRAYPARWRSSWLQTQHAGGGDVFDVWTGSVRPDFLERPLRALLVAGGAEGSPPALLGPEPDLRIPLRSPSGAASIRSAASNPRNDSSPIPDRRTAAFSVPGSAAGLVAGAAALIGALRPDLEPLAVRNALLDSADPEHAAAGLWVPGALEAALRKPRGACEAQLEQRGHQPTIAPPLWKRIKVRTE